MATLFEWDNIETPIQGKSNEWYTPARYVDAAREVMNGIDLDPASCEMANRVVRAKRYYTKEDNGLAQEWYGRVWLNPPYGSIDASRKKGISAFVGKLVMEYELGNIEQAVLLATCQVSSKWFIPLWQFPICFADHNIQFDCSIPNKHRYNGKDEHPYGTIFVYLGPNESKFIEVFSQFGRIARAIDTPKPMPAMRTLWEVEE